jgi:hypothetical protein
MDAALRPHLTNTCLQTDAYGALIREEGLVKLFWELEGMDALHLPTSARGGGDAETDFGSNENDQGSQRSRGEGQGRDVESKGRISQAWLDKVFERVGMVLDESVKAGVECGSFGLQLMPNAFEVCPTPCLPSSRHFPRTRKHIGDMYDGFIPCYRQPVHSLPTLYSERHALTARYSASTYSSPILLHPLHLHPPNRPYPS